MALVKLPSGQTIGEEYLRRVIIEGAGDTLDFMALKEFEPRDLSYIFGAWLNKELERFAEAVSKS